MKDASNPNQAVWMESISHRVIRSGFWSLSGNWLARGLSIIKMIVLARILVPQDFGVFGLAMLSVGCLSVFSEIGIEAALIQKARVHRNDLNTAWTMAIIRGALLFLLLFFLAGSIADYFHHDDLKPLLQVMAICFILEGLTNIGIVYFQKAIDFKKKVKLELLSDLCGSLSTVLLALFLKSVWALVLGSIIWRMSYCLLSYQMQPYRPKICLDRERSASLIHFGKHIFWISIVTFIVTSGDDALVGKILGLNLLGYYTMAYTIANIPVTSLASVIGRISFAAYSVIESDRDRLKEAFRRTFETTLLILLPLTILVIVLSEDFVRLFLGPRWLPMTGVLEILCLLGLFRGLSNVIAPLHLAINRPGLQSRNKTVELIVFLILVYPFTVGWGLIGAGWAVTICYLVSFILNALLTGSILKGFLKIIFRASLIPVAASIGLALVTILVQIGMKELITFFRFGIAGLSGVLAFGIIVLALDPSLIFNFMHRGIQK
jgi:O-antigen/teichoic acid export membrane protein